MFQLFRCLLQFSASCMLVLFFCTLHFALLYLLSLLSIIILQHLERLNNHYKFYNFKFTAKQLIWNLVHRNCINNFHKIYHWYCDYILDTLVDNEFAKRRQNVKPNALRDRFCSSDACQLRIQITVIISISLAATEESVNIKH